jgi:cysteinyl-tRNA synthetase
MVEGQKMSKSLGNFFTLRDLIAKGVDPLAFRYAIQSNHYRKVLNFSFDGLKAADASLARIRAFRRRMAGSGEVAGRGDWKEAVDPMTRLQQAREQFWSAMADDLNTPEALAALFTLVTDLNAQDDRVALSAEERQAVLAFLDETNAIFGGWAAEEDTLPAEIEALLAQRREARAAKQWAESDRLRDVLKSLGFLVEDRKDGSMTARRA